MHRVLHTLVAAAPLDARNDTTGEPGPARDRAAVLHYRVTAWHERATPPPGPRAEPLIGGLITPAGHLDNDMPTDQRAAIEQLETLITSRSAAITRQAALNPPTWLRALGGPPTDPRRRSMWIAAVGLVAAYRDRYQVPEHGHPLGDPDPPDPNQRVARLRALGASRQARVATTALPRTFSTAVRPVRGWPSL